MKFNVSRTVSLLLAGVLLVSWFAPLAPVGAAVGMEGLEPSGSAAPLMEGGSVPAGPSSVPTEEHIPGPSAPTEESTPRSSSAPTEGNVPESSSAPTEGNVPASSFAPTEESVPGSSSAPTEESIPASSSAPTEESVPGSSSAPTEESVPGSSSAPTEESLPETSVPAESTADTQPTETTAPTEAAPALLALSLDEPPVLDWNLYFGQLHAHTNLSDGLGSVSEAFFHASQAENLDFFAVTDHSDSFDNAESAEMARDAAAVSDAWAAGKAAAAAVTSEDFLGLFGYEMSWPEGRNLGHMSTFGTPGFASHRQEPFVHSLEKYYQALPAGSVSQFNHPGPEFGDFENFGHYSAQSDGKICLLEVGGEEGMAFCGCYPRALDAGWHVAPTTSQNNHNGQWGDARADRTVILARSLTEADLYDAMRHHRVYATSDGDLTVYYQLNGHIMGSILGEVDAPEVTVYLSDPTDEVIGQVDVMVDGGRVAASDFLAGPEGELALYPQGGYSYYYLRITQPDGDVALTAPVWTDSFTDMGIARFTADTLTPTQNQPFTLTVELFNNENTDFQVEKLEFFANGQPIHSVDAAGALAPRGYVPYSVSYSHPELGTTDFQVKVTGTAAGQSRVWRETLSLTFLTEELVTGILVDGSHGNDASLDGFTTLAADANMDVTVFDGDMPEGGDVLLIQAPAVAFEGDFLTRVLNFAETGGSIILCGQAAGRDGEVQSAGQINSLLETLGSTMRLQPDTARDDVNHGQDPDQLYTTVFNEGSAWCQGLTSAQTYAHLSGCTVDPGRGTWLVRSFSTAGNSVLLACENTLWGGRLILAGSPFLTDEAMPRPASPWAAPRVNQSILEGLLEIERARLPVSTIEDLRSGEPGQVYRVRGYVTAGTSRAKNRFPETLYLQDDTGGIAVVPFREEGIQVGTPMDVTGCLAEENGMPVLRWMDYDLPEESFYRYVPKTVRCKTAMDYGKYGGTLMQVEGKATALTLTDDEKGISRLTVTDYLGGRAEIMIEPFIGTGPGDENKLAREIKEGRMVRAMGISHLDDTGAPVLRVRNCEEVVYVPPRKKIPSDNPKTGDPLGALLAGNETS